MLKIRMKNAKILQELQMMKSFYHQLISVSMMMMNMIKQS